MSLPDPTALYARALPKAELHLHIEGTLEPELMFALARRNKIRLRFADEGELRRAYQFTHLQSFLDIYYEGCRVLQKERDFHDLALAYLRRAHDDGVRHAEIFFDPQTHAERGVPLGAVIEGLTAALRRAQKEWRLSSKLILCFLRHLSEDDALETFKQARPYLGRLAAVGLDSTENGNPPEKFKRAFDAARCAGLKAVAHAGEEGPPGYIYQALDILKVVRIDHGVRCLEDESLVERLASEQIPITVCPLSNVKLRVFDRLKNHNLKILLAKGLCVTINSDDPAYFGGYLLENFLASSRALHLSPGDMAQLARNSISASFLPEDEKKKLIAEINALPEPAR